MLVPETRAPEPDARAASRGPIAFPYLHFMAFAPLDAWARLLLAPPARVPARYWLRLLVGLLTSTLGMALTLPERLILAPILAIVGRRARYILHHPPGTVVILGYFRSGTTHLHNLLSCDTRCRAPKWHQTLAPQGFVVAWTFLRLFLIPFLANSRPQDDVPFGPEWPAEDDFALNNWAVASSLPGRVIVPDRYDHYRRFHFLTGLTPAEMSRWRRYQWAFVWKLSLLSPRRRILLKTPSHTARVPQLIDLLTSPGVKFIHISRSPVAVVRSNVAMMKRMEMYNLQDAPDQAETQRRIVEEYVESEERFAEAELAVAPGHLAQVRYEDLIADPIGELKRLYAELDLGWPADLEDRLRDYLCSVGEYKAATPAAAGIERPIGSLAPIAPLIERFGHDRPVRPSPGPTRGSPEAAAGQRRTGHHRRGLVTCAITALLTAAVWFGLAFLINNRSDWMVYPAGVVIGWGTIQAARVGSARLGLAAALLTLLVWVGVSFATTRWIYYWGNDHLRWWHIWDATQKEMRSGSTVPWVIIGALSAFRFASRVHIHPPGKG